MYETLDMSGLPDYTVGGTIHLVVNNQVGGRGGGRGDGWVGCVAGQLEGDRVVGFLGGGKGAGSTCSAGPLVPSFPACGLPRAPPPLPTLKTTPPY